MRRQKWYFKKGEKYLLSEVIGACDARIREGSVIRRESKDAKVRRMEPFDAEWISIVKGLQLLES